MAEKNDIFDVWLKENLSAANSAPLMSWEEFSTANAGKIPSNGSGRGIKYIGGAAAILLIAGSIYWFTQNNNIPAEVPETEIQIGEISKAIEKPAETQIQSPQGKEISTPKSGSGDITQETEILSEESTNEDKQALYNQMAQGLDQQKADNQNALNKLTADIDVVMPTEADFNSGFYVSPGRGESVTMHKPEKFLVTKSHEKGTLIDLRSTKEFEEGHIRGAVNIEFKVADFNQKMSRFKRDKPVFIYCHDGEVSKSAMAMLWKGGFYTVHILRGGVNAWKNAHYPLIKN